MEWPFLNDVDYFHLSFFSFVFNTATITARKDESKDCCVGCQYLYLGWKRILLTLGNFINVARNKNEIIFSHSFKNYNKILV